MFRRDVSQFSCLSALCRGTCNSVSAQWKYACLPYMLKGTILQVNETGCKKFFFSFSVQQCRVLEEIQCEQLCVRLRKTTGAR